MVKLGIRWQFIHCAIETLLICTINLNKMFSRRKHIHKTRNSCFSKKKKNPGLIIEEKSN